MCDLFNNKYCYLFVGFDNLDFGVLVFVLKFLICELKGYEGIY